jgi:gas vesicle protein
MKHKIAVGAVIGAAAGLIAGVLAAPKSGKETRADIKAKAEELKSGATVKANQAKDTANKAVEDIKSRL